MLNRPNTDILQEAAIKFAMAMLPTVSDTQEIEHALANDEMLGPFLEKTYSDIIPALQRIIRFAEQRLERK